MERLNPDSILVAHGIRPSKQRRAILSFIVEHPVHPTAEDVYRGLYKKIKTLSRTTVYNTLRLFCSRGAAQMVTLEENEMRFDACTAPHGHFKCSGCGKIYDFSCTDFFPESYKKNLPAGFTPTDVQLYVHGFCDACRERAGKK